MKDRAAYTHMRFAWKNDRVVTTKSYHEGNARISSRIPSHERSPYYFLITMGGGYVEGEDYQIDVEVEENASALITSQAPTYIFRSLNGELTTQEIHLNLDHHSVLEFLMDDLLPYKDAKYTQKTVINMKEDATLLYLDGVTSGWSPDDKDFQYDALHLDTQVYMNDELVVSDHFISIPKNFKSMAQLGLFENYKNYNSLIVINPDIDDHYIDSIRQQLDTVETNATYGISKLEVPGFVLRILGETMEDNKRYIFKCANQVRQDLLHYPSYQLRKNTYLDNETF